MTTIQKQPVSPIGHLTEADIEQIGIELDAIRLVVLKAAARLDAAGHRQMPEQGPDLAATWPARPAAGCTASFPEALARAGPYLAAHLAALPGGAPGGPPWLGCARGSPDRRQTRGHAPESPHRPPPPRRPSAASSSRTGKAGAAQLG